MHVGSVAGIWRYPVKSMAGERLDATPVGLLGLPGDRAWAVRDEERGGIRGAKKIPELMRSEARYLAEPTAGRAGDVEMRLPDGTTLRSDDPAVAERLSSALGTRVTLWPLQPADQLDHFRRGAPTHADLELELRSIFGLEPGEPLPDMSGLPPEILEFESPPGTYFDAFPLLLVSQCSLTSLARLAPGSKIDARRFRPNFVLELPEARDGFPEHEWAGRHVRIGGLTAEVTIPCMRCVMTTLPFDDLPKDPRIMRTLVRETRQCLGAYARVAEPGIVRIGDPVELV
ncbi:MAG: MOSC domain-containing protein [Deltaproteobacteria bacterium]|nr:MOSC domain-containing protein [Deltaproteobacteria bacterium]